MALTIKNPETIALARALASQTDMTQTGAITLALRQALEAAETADSDRAARVEAILQSIWATRSPGEAGRVERNARALFDQNGLPA
ncbi:MAG: type II toxin-antitoxin system VapB family antitoxin [Micrococcales bacterium]|nr:type II toxin-antitoxin system VapB family antitoxin [Micrococcales bacterium]